MKVIIAGSRGFDDYKILCDYCDKVLANQTEVEIISGGALGADKLGEKYAKQRGYSLIQFLADWGSYGKSAGYRRNVQMAEYADALIAFWDGKSKGTKHMINIADIKNLQIRIKTFNNT